MSIYFIDGFENGLKLERWDVYQQPGVSLVDGRSGGVAASLNDIYSDKCRVALPSGSFVLGFALLVHDWNTTSFASRRRVMSFNDSSDSILHSLGNDGDSSTFPNLYLTEGDGSDASGLKLAADFEHHLVFVELAIDRTGNTVSIWVEGQQQHDAAGLSNAGAIQYVQFEARGSKPILDDVYIREGLTRLGDVRIEGSMPNAVGESSDFSPSETGDNYEMVNETENVTDKYVTSSSVGDRDSYGFESPTGDGNILAVQADAFARSPSGGINALKVSTRVDGTYYDSDEHPVGGNWKAVTEIWTNNPSTNEKWTEQDIESAEFGFQLAEGD